MKRTGCNLRRRLRGISRLTDRLSRARHFRGHGVHSPFVYGLVREAFMFHRLRDGEHCLYDALRRVGIFHRRAVQLQNAFLYCGYRTFAISEGKAELVRTLPDAENEKSNSTFVIDEGRGCSQIVLGRENEAKNSTFGLNCAGPYDMVILTRNFPAEELLAAAARAVRTGTTLCVMNP
ncbi:hypothetical protein [Alistipes putredinis]|uniref:hypothetical protein n=1 Tax=Alistipes putredinis TaxID=28117 RepID=UPI003AB37399